MKTCRISCNTECCGTYVLYRNIQVSAEKISVCDLKTNIIGQVISKVPILMCPIYSIFWLVTNFLYFSLKLALDYQSIVFSLIVNDEIFYSGYI